MEAPFALWKGTQKERNKSDITLPRERPELDAEKSRGNFAPKKGERPLGAPHYYIWTMEKGGASRSYKVEQRELWTFLF